jgi:hypothetical protein
MTLDELKRFCGTRDFRDYLNAPFSLGEWTYACDGIIAVRIPRIDAVAERELPKSMLKLLPNYFTKEFSEWVPVPTVTIRPYENCDICYGTTEIECNLGHIHDCDACEGTGKQLGYTFDHKTMIGDTCFADKYLALIQGWEIAVDPSDVNAMAGIRLGEIRGLLMSRRKD